MKRICIALAFLLLASCTVTIPDMTPEAAAQMQQKLVTGQAELDCRLTCVKEYVAARPLMLKMYNAQDWAGLGKLTMQIGVQQDLSYFYLARAAEGLGAYEAAKKYYLTAGYIATSLPWKCNGVFDLCDGFSFPRDIYPRLQFVKSAIAQSQMASMRPATPVSEPNAASRPAAPARQTARASKPAAEVVADADWVRPPPVTR